MRIKVQHVRFMPKELIPGVLYVSDEFGTAVHLCACGCGSKIRTPLGPTEWTLDETGKGPSLHPSIGNWQQDCRSHYWIYEGRIQWSKKWTTEEIADGRSYEEKRRRAHYDALQNQRKGFWSWLRKLFRR